MQGILVRYRYGGDEQAWNQTVSSFVRALAADGDVAGKFRYTVTTANDGVSRTHLGRWDSDATLKTVQSRDYFKTFSEAVQGYAGDSLESTRMSIAATTD